MRPTLLLLAALTTGGAAPVCHDMLEAQLFFGAVDDPAFTRFLDTTVTPAFPAGLTILDAAGRWRDPQGHLTQEHAKLVVIITQPGPKALARLQAIRTAYRTQFTQQSVGMVLQHVCADF